MSELFLAEAAVRVRADTSGFRAALLAEVQASVKAAEAIAKVRITPIAASAAGVGAAAGATEQAAASKIATTAIKEETAATASLTTTKKQQDVFTRAATASETAYAAAAKRTVLAETAGTTAVSELAAARAKYQASIRANIAADTAWRLSLKSGNAEIITQNASLFARASALQASSAAELRNAEATAIAADASNARAAALGREAKADAARTAQATRGAAATGLAAAGARGATLAASGPFLAGAAAAVALGKSIQIAAQFNRELNVLQVTAGATADEMAAVSDEARKLGRDVSLPAVSAVDAAQAMTELSKAGLSVEDSLRGARGVLQLAAAAQIDNASATELAASALNAFGLAGDQAVHVADVLTNAANDAQGSISDMGAALQQAAAVGRQAGLTLEQTTAILTLFARNGLRGSDAGTSLRTMMIRLINPTQKASELMKSLGLNLRTANGAINLDVFDQFTQATKNFTKAQRDRDLAIIFGQDAIRGASIAAREGTAAIDAQVDSLNKSGAAAQLAGARAKGLAGEASALKSNLETLALTTGNVLNPVLEHLVTTLDRAVIGLNLGTDAVGRFFKALGNRGEFDAANADFASLTEELAKTQKELTTFRESGGKQAPALTADITDLEKRIRDIGQALVAVGPAGVQKMLAGFKAASPQIQQALQDGVITPLEKAQLSSSALGRAFVASLPKRFFVGLGADVRSGIEDATAQAKEGVADLGPEIASAIEDQSRAAIVGARNFGSNIGNALKESMGAAWASANAAFRQGQLEFNQAVIEDSTRGQIAALDVQIAAQQKILDDATKKLAGLSKGQPGFKLQKERQAAATSALAGLFTQRRGLVESVAAEARAAVQEAKNRAAEIERARNEADQAFLKSLEPRRAILDRLMAVAEGTEGEADNRRILIALKKRAFAEMKLIDEHVKDKRLAAQLIEARRNEIVNLDNRIADANKAIADSAKETARKRADAFTDLLGKRITLAGLREDRGAELAAINRAIANARKRVRDFKKLGTLQIDEKIALEELINRRDDLLGTVKDGTKQGTTAFDLLKQFADTFRNVGGNLINVNQPFAGPTGFTADIAQFLVRRPGAQTTRPTATTAAAAKTPIELNDDRLVRSMDRLADVIERSGGNQTAGAPVSVEGQRWSAIGRYWEGRMTRDAIQANNG